MLSLFLGAKWVGNASFLALHADQAAVARIDFELDNLAVGLKQPDFIDEPAILPVELHLDHLALVLLLDPVQNRAQWQDLALAQGLACHFVIVVTGVRGGGPHRQRAKTGRGQQQREQGMALAESARRSIGGAVVVMVGW